jgi:glycosyltransferase involved in cell wall biosynthesis
MSKYTIIYFSTTTSFFTSFLTDLILRSKNIFFEVCIASNFGDDINHSKLNNIGELYNFTFSRNPLSVNNFLSINKIKNLLKSKSNVLIHTQTPIASAIVRVSNNRNPLIYSAHGFHFHSKSIFLNWLLFFPIEFLLSFKTDVLVTINKEDYNLAKNFFRPKRLELIHGAGADFSRFSNIEKSKDYLNHLGISKSSKVLVSVGELNNNKNHSVVIQLLAKRAELHEVHYVICGEGSYRADLEQQINKLGLSNRVHLLGYRKDIPSILAASDLFVFPSKREGLPMALLEAILSDLDFVAFRIRGIVDLVPEKIHPSHLVEAYNKRLMGDMIVDKITHPQPFSHTEHLQWLKQFSMEEVNEQYLNLYESLLTGKDPSHT